MTIDNCPNNMKDQIKVLYNNRSAAYEKLDMSENVIEDCTVGLTFDPLYSKVIRAPYVYIMYAYDCMCI